MEQMEIYANTRTYRVAKKNGDESEPEVVQVGEMKRSDAGLRMEISQWKSNVTGNIRRLSSSVAGFQVEVSHLKKLLSCPHGWVNFKQSCYLFPSSSHTWEEAQKSCMSADAHLVVINNAEEQDFLKKKDRVRRWIGLTDKASEGDWRWVDGTDYKSFAKFWNKGEPNNENDEDCVEMYIGGNWNDLPCNGTLGWICEKPAQ
ncbi:CD209 antigen-like protein C [Amblyraja radiata]|uniref:CD209 antigen-like protein C n=1 Tax=Amblyraja radiata TaxID=386614 RepID=UPI0014020B5C|nr:CD209 antigen-like protein C [Amblyraja radiata]